MTARRIRFIIPAIALAILAFWLLKQQFQPRPDHRNTAHIFMLTTLSIWDSQGILTYHAAPIQTWPDAKKFNHYYKRLQDRDGNNYYISHPPLAFIANFAIIKLLNLDIDQQSLQIISLILFLAGAFILVWIFRQLSIQPEKRSVYHAMLAVMAFYLLNPVNLFAHSQHNFSEIWGQFFLILSVAAWIFHLRSDRVILSRGILFVSVAMLTATDWMGLTFMAALVLVYFKQLRKPHIRRGLLVALSAVFFAGATVLYQYVSIAGFSEFYRALGVRFLERSGYFGEQYTDMGYHILNPETWGLVLNQIHQLLLGPGYLVLALAVACLLVKRKSCPTAEMPVQKLFFWTAMLFFAAVFSAGATHYIYTARFTPFLAIAGGALLEKIIIASKKPIWITAAFIFLMHPLCFWSVNTFEKTLPTPELKQSQLNAIADVVSRDQRDSLMIQPSLEARDIIYLSWKSKRNLVWMNNAK